MLKRGFALVRDRNGKLIRRAKQINPGSPLSLSFEDGSISATASLIDSYEPGPVSMVRPPVPPEEDTATAENRQHTEGGDALEAVSTGIMSADAISAEDIEAHLRTIAGKRARRRVAKAKDIPVEKVPEPETPEGEPAAIPQEENAPVEKAIAKVLTEDASAERLEKATAKLTKAIEQEILTRLKEQDKPKEPKKPSRPRKKSSKKGDDDAQGSLF